MSTSRTGFPADDRSRAFLAALAPDPPAWAVEHFAAALRDRAGLDDWRLVSAEIPDCAALDAPALERAVRDAYRTIAESLAASGHHPVRCWNFVPGIHADMGGGLDRYMVFNAGRYAAFEEWFGQAALFTRTVPTASAVGIGSGALAIHTLGGRRAGVPVENPTHPTDILATVYHSLGIQPTTEIRNHLNQPRELVKGTPVTALFG